MREANRHATVQILWVRRLAEMASRGSLAWSPDRFRVGQDWVAAQRPNIAIHALTGPTCVGTNLADADSQAPALTSWARSWNEDTLRGRPLPVPSPAG